MIPRRRVMMPIGLSDQQLELLLDSAFPFAPEQRTTFLNEVVTELLRSDTVSDATVEFACLKVAARIRAQCSCCSSGGCAA
jgi:hypothetical protein